MVEHEILQELANIVASRISYYTNALCKISSHEHRILHSVHKVIIEFYSKYTQITHIMTVCGDGAYYFEMIFRSRSIDMYDDDLVDGIVNTYNDYLSNIVRKVGENESYKNSS